MTYSLCKYQSPLNEAAVRATFLPSLSMLQIFKMTSDLEYIVIAERDDLRARDLRFESGYAAATETGRLTFSEHVEQVLNPAIASHKISDGTNDEYDDRKLRFDRIEGSTIYLGATDFYTYLHDEKLTEQEASALRDRGTANFNDPFAHFSRPLGVTVLPVTSEGALVLGRRLNKQYHNYINGAAGYVTFREPSKENIEGDAERELWEEFGVSRVQSMFPIGISAHPKTGETDITYLAFVNHSNGHFTSPRWKTVVDFYGNRIEHDDPLVLLKSHRDVHELLSGKHPHSGRMMYATHHGITQLRTVDIPA